MQTKSISFIEQCLKRNDWHALANLIDVNQTIQENTSHLINTYTIKEFETIIFGLTKHIDLILKEYEISSSNQSIEKQCILAETILTQLIYDYDFIVYSAENIDSLDIKKSYAYLERNIFKSMLNSIKKIIRDNSLDEKLIANLNNRFNNARSCVQAVYYYNIILNAQPNDIKSLYRYATTISSITTFSLPKNKQDEYFSQTKINNYFYRVNTAKNVLLKVLNIYDQKSLEEQKSLRKYYIKSLYNLITLLNDKCDFYFKDVKLFNYISNEQVVYLNLSPDVKTQLYNDLILIYNSLKTLLAELNLPEKRLDEVIVYQIAKRNDLDIEPFYIYYRVGKVYELFAKTAISNIKSINNADAFARYVNNMLKAIDMYENVGDIKYQIKLFHKNTGGFIYELYQLGYCFSLLALNNPIYAEKLNSLFTKYSLKKGKRYTNLIDELNYYKALTFIYNKHTQNIQTAINILKKLELITKKNKNTKILKKAQSLLTNIQENKI